MTPFEKYLISSILLAVFKSNYTVNMENDIFTHF